MPNEKALVFGVFSCIIVIILSISSYYKHQDDIIAKMVADGQSPLEAVCTMSDTLGSNPTCIILATNKKEDILWLSDAKNVKTTKQSD